MDFHSIVSHVHSRSLCFTATCLTLTTATSFLPAIPCLPAWFPAADSLPPRSLPLLFRTAACACCFALLPFLAVPLHLTLPVLHLPAVLVPFSCRSPAFRRHGSRTAPYLPALPRRLRHTCRTFLILLPYLTVCCRFQRTALLDYALLALRSTAIPAGLRILPPPYRFVHLLDRAMIIHRCTACLWIVRLLLHWVPAYCLLPASAVYSPPLILC